MRTSTCAAIGTDDAAIFAVVSLFLAYLATDVALCGTVLVWRSTR